MNLIRLVKISEIEEYCGREFFKKIYHRVDDFVEDHVIFSKSALMQM